MSFLGRALEKRSGQTFSFANPGEAGMEIWGATPSSSGKTVTAKTARTIPALFSGVRNISEDLASLPIGVYRRNPKGGREQIRVGDAAQMLQVRPNPWQTPMQFREMITAHALLWGNGYAGVEQAGNGTITRMIPWHPCRTVLLLAPDGSVWYRYTDQFGNTEVYSADEVLHIKGPSDDGYVGLCLFDLFKNTLGLSLAAEEFAGKTLANDATPSGALTTDKILSDDAWKKLKARWAARHQGSPNSQQFAVLEDGLKWQSFAFNNEQTQFLESRQFQIEEIARVLRIPPHKIGHLERSTNNNIEQQSIEYVVDSIRVWCIRWEQPLNNCLFTDDQRKAGYYVEHNVDGLLRGDAISRAQSLAIKRQNGALSANEWRELDNQNPVDGGDEMLVPMNTQSLDQLGKTPPAPIGKKPGGQPVAAGSGSPNDGGRRALRRAAAIAIGDSIARIQRRRAGGEKGLQDYAERALEPALLSYRMGLMDLTGGMTALSPVGLATLAEQCAKGARDEDVLEAALTMIETSLVMPAA